MRGSWGVLLLALALTGCQSPSFVGGSVDIPAWTVGDYFEYETRERWGSFADGVSDWGPWAAGNARLTFVRDHAPEGSMTYSNDRPIALIEGHLFPGGRAGIYELDRHEGYRFPRAVEWRATCDAVCDVGLVFPWAEGRDILPSVRLPAEQGDSWDSWPTHRGLPYRTNTTVLGIHDVETGLGSIQGLRLQTTGTVDQDRLAAFVASLGQPPGADEGSHDVTVTVAYEAAQDHALDLGVRAFHHLRAVFLVEESWTEGGNGMSSTEHWALEHEARLVAHGAGDAWTDDELASALGLDRPELAAGTTPGVGGRLGVRVEGAFDEAGPGALARFTIVPGASSLPGSADIAWSVQAGEVVVAAGDGLSFEHRFEHPGQYRVHGSVMSEGRLWDRYEADFEVGWSAEVQASCSFTVEYCAEFVLPVGAADVRYDVSADVDAPARLLGAHLWVMNGHDGVAAHDDKELSASVIAEGGSGDHAAFLDVDDAGASVVLRAVATPI